ncbi:MAG: hypothetical protein HHAS10_06900 [Candidatus Altimarinota bacterium]
MKSSSYRSSGGNNVHEWVSAIGTLLVLGSVYASMDSFSSYAPQQTEKVSANESTSPPSVAPPYWSSTHGYGFRSIAGDVYDASSSNMKDVVSVRGSDSKPNNTDIKVSYFREGDIESIDKTISPETPRAYSKLSHGIAVIEGNLDSARAKTIFSTIHSD